MLFINDALIGSYLISMFSLHTNWCAGWSVGLWPGRPLYRKVHKAKEAVSFKNVSIFTPITCMGVR